MPSIRPIGNIREAVIQRAFPTITRWNRIEGRPRTTSFDRALRAEVRDALWMLTKQWQMGEFRGSDAGSPVFAKLDITTTRLTKYQPGSHSTIAFPNDIPLETVVERRPISTTVANRVSALDLRIATGRRWLAMIESVGPYRQAFINAYPVAAPNPSGTADADICAHPEVWQTFAAAAGRAMDGYLLYEHLKANRANHAYDGVTGITPADQATIDALATRFIASVERILSPPTNGDNAWAPTQLEYQFAASAPLPAPGTEKVYVADQYYEGRLDWYSVDLDPTIPALGDVPGSQNTGLPPDAPRSMIPVPVSFAGMPNTRWWAFEDRATNFGDIDAATTDLAKLLFIEFALVYANDWFVIPYTLPAGAIATINGAVVTNVFGERLWITPADAGPDAAWQRWSMFTINTRGAGSADTSLLLMPSPAKIQDGPPTEDIWLIRDEVANMVWGIERAIPLASGDTKPGLEAARQSLSFYETDLANRLGHPPSPPATTNTAPRYQVMTTVPENWIPFLPVHVDGDNRTIQLQRAAMPRILEGDPNPARKVQPRTVLLRNGLDDTPPQPYFVHEEEIPRAGTRLTQAYQRTRWTDGQVYTWLRVRRQTGRGEGSSGLAFDQLIP
ncbi:hypothetical protein [Mycobacterium sp.]|uniref:hypothetical protein n=1 Tax=Mycobacterium sp. TaxID=1785 RepID=UPI002CEF8E15|nr:hypothetical protein [Mycobacterium sp.]HTY30752.1 hypothetical protein [Mycobacterium sp.]